MEPPDPRVEEVAQFERRLRRQADARTVAGGDPTLDALLRTIERRRARRSTDPGPARRSAEPGPARRSAEPGRAVRPTRQQDPALDAAAGSDPRIMALTEHGPTVRVFRVSRPAGFTFAPGQYAKLGVPGGRREDFSIASAPHEAHLEFAIELRPGGRVTPALFARRVGDAIALEPKAKGSLRLAASATHHLMVATVTGIAPLRSMVRDALHRAGSATFTVLLGASHAVELPFHDELTDLAAQQPRLTYRATISRPGTPGTLRWDGATGRVDELATSVAATLDPAATQVYAVGHRGMIESVRRSLGARGFRIATESYGG